MKPSAYQFQRHRVDRISRERIIAELTRVAELHKYTYFTSKEFKKSASMGHQVVFREFGTWHNAIDCLRSILKEKGITLRQRAKPKRKDAYTQRELFAEMERVWTKVGHRPSKSEWEQSDPQINYNTVRRHFSGWTSACLMFIEYVTGEPDGSSRWKEEEERITRVTEYKPENSRTIPLGIRLEVLARDRFRCVFCGRSPASDVGTVLHVDHITPFAGGGRTIQSNLQTLCRDCNLGKGNRKVA